MIIYKNLKYAKSSQYPNIDWTDGTETKYIVDDNSELSIKILSIQDLSTANFIEDSQGNLVDVQENISTIKEKKIEEIKTELDNVLNTGTTYQDKNYSLNVQKRNEIEQYKQFALWGNPIKYYADDNTFKTFTSSEFLEMAKFLQGFILENELHTLYLGQDINDMTTAEQVNVINYNSALSTARQTILDNDIAEYNASTYETTGQMMTREEIAKLDYLAEIQSGGV